MKNSILFKPCIEGSTPPAGSHRQGQIRASFADLREMFGQPAFQGYGDFVTTEFVIDYEYYNKTLEETEYGSFCLYDWGYARDFKNDYETINWNVGGHKLLDSIAADHAVRLFNNTDIRYAYDGSVLAHANWHEVQREEFPSGIS